MHSISSKTRGALLFNVGTPQSPNPSDVKEYLREFLMDPYVIDIPQWIRWFLVHAVILPRRPKNSAEAYEKIWTDRGSPLLFHLRDLAEKVQGKLGGDWSVEPVMRYGQPRLREALKRFQEKGIHEVVVFPLYPQYSLAATETVIQHCKAEVARMAPEMKLKFVGAFYNQPALVECFASVIRESLEGYEYDHLLVSFHGLPERQVKKTDCSGKHCLASAQCCEKISEVNQNCYRAQCYQTAHQIAQKLGISQGRYSVAFQSRLGGGKWIQPYTDVVYHELAQKGVKRLAVACPAFVADCLETLEEIRIRGKEDFIQAGGEDLRLIPSLNSREDWVNTVAEMLQSQSFS